jgi:hypothetical protein
MNSEIITAYCFHCKCERKHKVTPGGNQICQFCGSVTVKEEVIK